MASSKRMLGVKQMAWVVTETAQPGSRIAGCRRPDGAGSGRVARSSSGSAGHLIGGASAPFTRFVTPRILPPPPSVSPS